MYSKFTRLSFLFFCIILHCQLFANDCFNIKLDPKVYRTDTVFKAKSMIVTYLDLKTNNKLIVYFDAKSINKPDGICIFKASNGIRVEGKYKSGELVGEWVERDKYNTIVRKINYDYERINRSRDSLNFQENIQSDNEHFMHVANMPSFKN